jgi:hypothetical protein
LNETKALLLIQQEAELRNFRRITTASNTQLKKIYEVVGGNPLALRLVIGQTHTHTLDTILEALTLAQGYKAEALYTFIYRQAWERLDDLTRQVFLNMPLVTSRGGGLDYLAFLTGLPPLTLRQTLDHLVALNLVDSNNASTEPELRYSIHNLTRTFLQEQIGKWQ